MRTTGEITDSQRARLLLLAAERGAKGFSLLAAERGAKGFSSVSPKFQRQEQDNPLYVRVIDVFKLQGYWVQ